MAIASNEEFMMDQDNILKSASTAPSPETSAFNVKEGRRPVKKQSVDWKSYLIYFALGTLMCGAIGLFIYSKLSKNRGGENSLNDFSQVEIQEPATEEVINDPLSPEGFAQGQQSLPSSKQPPASSLDSGQNTVPDGMMVVDQGGDKFYLPQKNGVANDEAALNSNPVDEKAKFEERISDIESKLESVPNKTDVEQISEEVKKIALLLAELKTKVDAIPASKADRKTVARVANKQHAARSSGAPVPRATSKAAPVKRTAPQQIAAAQPALTLRAVVQDQAWLDNASGETISISVAKPFLAGYGRAVRFDGENFKVCFDSGKCISAQ